MIAYNLSIFCVDGETIYGLISPDRKLLLSFLNKHDHEGSTVTLVRHEGEEFTTIDNPELVYEELGYDLQTHSPCSRE